MAWRPFSARPAPFVLDRACFALFSIFIDGDPGAAVVTVNERPLGNRGGEHDHELRLLFVNLTPGMKIRWANYLSVSGPTIKQQ